MFVLGGNYPGIPSVAPSDGLIVLDDSECFVHWFSSGLLMNANDMIDDLLHLSIYLHIYLHEPQEVGMLVNFELGVTEDRMRRMWCRRNSWCSCRPCWGFLCCE